MVNGHVKQYVALSYTPQPKSTGSFVIPPATARVEGTPYKSNAVSIQVVAGSTGNGQQQATTNPLPWEFFDEPVPRAAGRDFILKKGEDPPGEDKEEHVCFTGSGPAELLCRRTRGGHL